MENGEWRMENGEWRMENGEWRMENGEWRMEGVSVWLKLNLMDARTFPGSQIKFGMTSLTSDETLTCELKGGDESLIP